eukprot:SAG31_NODE_14467_length_804_cov_1.804255_1_plen_72_part_10
MSTGGKVNVLEVSKKMSGYEVSYGNHDDIASPTGMHAYTVVNIPLCLPCAVLSAPLYCFALLFPSSCSLSVP